MDRSLKAGTPVALYARASVPEGTQQQIERLNTWADAHGLVVTDTWTDCTSGGSSVKERPGLIAGLEAMRAGLTSPKAILVTRYDRAFRCAEDYIEFRRLLADQEIELRELEGYERVG